MKYKCKVEGCNYETDSRQGIAGHTGGHVRRGELAKKAAYTKVSERQPQPQLQPPTPSEIATALLNTVVDVINKEQSLQEQLRAAKKMNVNLTESLARAEEERDRVIRIHDEQVKAANKHGTDLPSTEKLMKVAKLR